MTIAELIQSANAALASGWSALLQKKIELGAVDVATVGTNDYAEELKGRFVICGMALSGDVEGTMSMVIRDKDALTMVGMMLSMGANDALIASTRDGELGAEQLDALQEVFSQTASTIATDWRGKLNCTLKMSADPATTVEFSGKIESGDSDQLVRSALTLEGFEPTHAYVTMDEALAKALSADKIEPKAAPAVASAPAPAAAAAQAPAAPAPAGSLERIMDIAVTAEVILAEREIEFEDLMKLNTGSVLQFWKNCDSPAELCIGDAILANGEVVTKQDHKFGLRIFEMAPAPLEYRRK